jgi:Amt family ammonium transporter
LLQAGFALLEAGTIRQKNVRNVLLKNLMDACMSALAWWVLGSAFSQGAPGGCDNPFIGSSGFFLAGVDATGFNYAHWLFNWAFCATSSAIVSGAIAERTQFRA